MIYVIRRENTNQFKIGYTKHHNVAMRIARLQTSTPDRLVKWATFEGTLYDERHLHSKLSKYHIHRGGGTEWFEVDDTTLREILDSYFSKQKELDELRRRRREVGPGPVAPEPTSVTTRSSQPDVVANPIRESRAEKFAEGCSQSAVFIFLVFGLTAIFVLMARYVCPALMPSTKASEAEKLLPLVSVPLLSIFYFAIFRRFAREDRWSRSKAWGAVFMVLLFMSIPGIVSFLQAMLAIL